MHTRFLCGLVPGSAYKEMNTSFSPLMIPSVNEAASPCFHFFHCEVKFAYNRGMHALAPQHVTTVDHFL